MNRRMYWGALLALIVLHWGVVALYATGTIPQDYRRADQPFWMHQGGDNYDYHALALQMSNGEFEEASKYPMGYSLMLLPFVWLSGGAGHDALVQPVSAWWAIVMMPLIQILLAWQTYQLTHKRAIALGAVLLYTLLPLIVWATMYVVWNPIMAELISVHMIGAQMLSDIPTTLLTLIAFALYWHIRQVDDGKRIGWVILLGIMLGWLVMVRYSAAVTPIAFALLLLLERRWRALVVVTLVALIIFAPQMLYNQHFFGSPLTTGYEILDELPPEGLFSITYLFEAIGKMWARLGVGLVMVAIIAGSGLLWVLWRLWRIERMGTLWLGLWLAWYIGFYATYYYSWTGAMGRFMIPIYPALALIGAFLLAEIWRLVRPSRE
jgi:hypothetical protein